MKKIFLLCFPLLMLVSCKEGGIFSNRPKDVLPKSQLVDLLVDLNIADSKFRAVPSIIRFNDTVRNYYRQGYTSIFRKYNTSPDGFKATLTYYSQKPDVMKEILDEVIAKLAEMETSLMPKADTVKQKKKFRPQDTNLEKKKKK